MKNMSDYQKKLADAPYHPGYEDAVITEPKPVLTGIYKSKPLTDEEIKQIENKISGGVACYDDFNFVEFARAIEERHGIK
jgi:hypothetical protein